MATAFFFAGLGYAVAQTKPHHKKPHHKVKHKTTAVVTKKPDVKDAKVTTTTTVKTKTDKKK